MARAGVSLDPTKRQRMPKPGGPGKLLSKEHFLRWMLEFARKNGIHLQFDGAERGSETHDGAYFKLAPGGDELADFAFRAKDINGSLWMMAGSYNGVAVAAIEIGNSATGYGYIKAEWDISDVEAGYVMSVPPVTSVTFHTAASVPADSGGTGTFYVPLIQFAAGVVLGQIRSSAISAVVCDSGAGNGSAQHNIL